MRQIVVATLLGLACSFGLQSCYHRSVLTDSFREELDQVRVERELDQAALAHLQKRLKAASSDEERLQIADEMHAEFVRGRFPSAQECRRCHQEHYRQWSVSPHAYAQLSPIFNAMQGTITKLSHGTNGDFCIRCHTPVGMTLGERVFMASAERHPTSLEGVTCIACHRVNQAYGKISARFGMMTGDIHTPIYGPTGNTEVQRVAADPETFSVRTSPDQKSGQSMHNQAQRFFQLTNSAFCGMCHDVNGPGGFRLEEAFSEYKASPAAARGESCQDCHMSLDPGEAAGFAEGSAAVINGIGTRRRKLTNHMFVGPDYSLVHAGIYPHNPKSVKHSLNPGGLATIDEWLGFDDEAGWGRPEFEEDLARRMASGEAGPRFPERWINRSEREKARAILSEQHSLLAEQAEARRSLLKKGYRLGDINQTRSENQIDLSVAVENGTDGHNVPTGFTAERVVFLRITARDASDRIIYQSGDLDPNGDLRDAHSLYVHNGERPLDSELFSLQSKFITRNERGGEREQILAVNYSQNPLAFIRPATDASILTGRPGDARIHKRNIPPGARRLANYKISLDEQARASAVNIEVQLIAAMVPVNLISAIQDVGFDFGLSPREVARRLVAGHQVLWEKQLTIAAR